MRKLVIKFFALDYIVRVFGSTYNWTRGANIIFPLFILAGMCLLSELYVLLCIMVCLIAIAVFFGFAYFQLFPLTENDRKYFWPDIYKYLFRATTFAKFKRYSKIQENIDKVREEYNNLPDEEKTYDFYKDILKEVDELEEKLKEGEESVEKHIEAMEYKSLLAWKMEKLLKK